MIYLDNAATTGRKPEPVLETFRSAVEHFSVNAGRGSYQLARDAAKELDACRQGLLRLAGIHSGYRVYFSPSATVALNQLILGLPCDHSQFWVTPFEHNAVMRPLEAVCRRNDCRWAPLPFDKKTWTFDQAAARFMAGRSRPDYVIVSAVSNVTGYVLPLKEIIALAHERGARVIVDCAQALGAVPMDCGRLGADAYIFAGHKTLLGPYGAAGMILSDSWNPPPGLFGGTGTRSLDLEMPSPSEGGYEPGSQDVPAIAALHTAVQWLLDQSVEKIADHEQKLVSRFVQQCKDLPLVKLLLPPEGRRSGIVSFCVKGYESNEVGNILDQEFGIAVRTGYQCAPLIHEWLNTRKHQGVVRMSVSWFNTEEEIDDLVKALATIKEKG